MPVNVYPAPPVSDPALLIYCAQTADLHKRMTAELHISRHRDLQLTFHLV